MLETHSMSLDPGQGGAPGTRPGVDLDAGCQWLSEATKQ